MIRYLDLSDEVDATIARYVITNPPNDFNLLPTDQVCINARKMNRRVVIMKTVSGRWMNIMAMMQA